MNKKEISLAMAKDIGLVRRPNLYKSLPKLFGIFPRDRNSTKEELGQERLKIYKDYNVTKNLTVFFTREEIEKAIKKL